MAPRRGRWQVLWWFVWGAHIDSLTVDLALPTGMVLVTVAAESGVAWWSGAELGLRISLLPMEPGGCWNSR